MLSEPPELSSSPPPGIGRIDVHSHMVPGVDDGCRTLHESIACGKRLVAAGYTHSFCTPHIWPHLPDNSADLIPRRVMELQEAFDGAGVNLRLYPGGEMNLRPGMPERAGEPVVSYGMKGKFILFDIWAEKMPAFFKPTVQWLQSHGATAILAHPERMRAVQDDPGLVRFFKDELGLLLQGNLQCLGDPPSAATHRVMQRYIHAGEYFVLGSDLHNPQSMDVRINGLARAIELVGDEEVNRLTISNPWEILKAVI